MSSELLNLSPEDIKRMASVLANVLAENPDVLESVETVDVGSAIVVPEESITHVIDLEAIASSEAGALDVLGQIQDWFKSVLDSISSWIVSSVESFIEENVSPLFDWVYDSVTSFIDTYVLPAFDSLYSNIRWFIDTYVLPAIDNVITTITDFIYDVVIPTITDVSTTLSNIISKGLSDLSGTVSSMFDSLSSTISGLFSDLSDAISGFVNQISNAISGLGATISDMFSDLATTISKAIGDLGSTIGKMLGDAVSEIGSVVAKMGESIVSSISGIVSDLGRAISEMGSSIINAVKSSIESVSKAVSEMGSSITRSISELGESFTKALSGVVTSISKMFEDFAKGITHVINEAVAGLTESISEMGSTIASALSDMGNMIVNGVLEGISGVTESIAGVVEQISKAIAGIGEGINNLYVYIMSSYQDMVTKVSLGFQVITERLTGFVNSVLQLPDLLFGKINVDLVNRVWGGLEWLWNNVVGSFKWLAGAIQQGAKAFIEAIGGIYEGIGKIIGGMLTGAWKVFTKISDIIKPLFEEVYKPLPGAMSEAYKNTIMPVIKDTIKSVGIGTPEYLKVENIEGMILKNLSMSFVMALVPLWAQLPVRLASALMVNVGSFIYNKNLPISIDLTPLGIGVRFQFNVARAIGASLSHMGKELRRYLDEIGRAIVYGLAIWVTQPFTRVLNVYLRNAIPIELPRPVELIEVVRRSIPHETFGEKLKLARYYMSLYGYSDYVIDLFFKEADKYYIEITDRFDQPRKIPLSLMYELPSASDVARMVVRDIVLKVEDLKRFFMARGMHEDIGVLYYLLHFRYPPPERLWEFTMRGVSGLLWARIPDEEKDELVNEIQKIGLDPTQWFPKAPYELNFKHGKLFSAFKKYMKWHDYARFPYIKGFTTDNLIMVDTLADIPTKIDQRWMVKWGLYQLLSNAGVKITSTIDEFVKLFKPGEAPDDLKKGIYLNLQNFCRTLQATGLHPYWTPIVAVAEAMNALTEERTFIRTGFMNLFKEGFWNVTALEKLLAGFIHVVFDVAYFDIAEMEWKSAHINMPVMYLPPERKLIELRALMDRALDILREIQRDISRGYTEHIVLSYEEYKEKLTGVINSINEFFAKDYESITGVKLPDELKLKYVEEYYKPYVEALKIYRDVVTVRRMRYWARRWIGWAMYRIASGLVTREDMSKLLGYIKDYTKITDKEAEFLRKVMEVFLAIAEREMAGAYMPTPQTLATLSEYMSLPEDLVKQVLEVRHVPEEWIKIWLTYIRVKPVKSDAKSLLSTYIRAYKYGVVSEDELKKFTSELPDYGFTKREIELIEKRASLEYTIEVLRKERDIWIPTLSTLATFSEYMKIPEEYVKMVFEARHVPEEWRKLWLYYYNVRPIKPDAKSLLTAYLRGLRYGVVERKEVDSFIEELSKYGFTDREIEFIRKKVDIEEAITQLLREREQYIPTPYTLASLSEYVVIPEDVITRVFEARRVPEEWRSIWRNYIKVRPLADDIKALLNTFRRASVYFKVPDEIAKKVMDYAKMINFTEKELEVFDLRVKLEAMIEEYLEDRRAYIPTPYMLATLVEYLPEARKFFDEVMKAKHVPENWRELWAKYIDVRPLYNDIRRYMSRAEDLYVYFMIKKDDFTKILDEIKDYLGYTDKEIEFLMKVTEFERARRAWIELIGTVDRLVSLSEYSPTASKYALGRLYAIIDSLPVSPQEKQELKKMWEEYIKNRPVKSEAKMYITQLINLFVDGLITVDDFEKELEAMKKWGFSDNEIMFYKAIAKLRKARKLRIPLTYTGE